MNLQIDTEFSPVLYYVFKDLYSAVYIISLPDNIAICIHSNKSNAGRIINIACLTGTILCTNASLPTRQTLCVWACVYEIRNHCDVVGNVLPAKQTRRVQSEIMLAVEFRQSLLSTRTVRKSSLPRKRRELIVFKRYSPYKLFCWILDWPGHPFVLT